MGGARCHILGESKFFIINPDGDLFSSGMSIN